MQLRPATPEGQALRELLPAVPDSAGEPAWFPPPGVAGSIHGFSHFEVPALPKAPPLIPPCPESERRSARGRLAQSRGVAAEQAACEALERDGWTVLARRLRTAAGEIDLVAERQGVLAVIEVKRRATLADAAASLGQRQRRRLVAAAEQLLAAQPGWGRAGVRFDVIVVDAAGRVRRITDAFRPE